MFEDDGGVDITVQRFGKLEGTVSVRYTTKDITANAPDDYEHTEGQLVFKPGQRTRTISIKVIEDKKYEDDETFEVILSDIMHSYGDKNTSASAAADESN